MSFVVPLFHHEASEYLKLVWIIVKKNIFRPPGWISFCPGGFSQTKYFLDHLTILVSSGKTDVFILNVYQLSSPKLWPQMIWPHMVRNTPHQTMPNRSMKFLCINSSCDMMRKLYRTHCTSRPCSRRLPPSQKKASGDDPGRKLYQRGSPVISSAFPPIVELHHITAFRLFLRGKSSKSFSGEIFRVHRVTWHCFDVKYLTDLVVNWLTLLLLSFLVSDVRRASKLCF